MSDQEVEALARQGEIEPAAALAESRGQWRRAAELLASVGRVADAALCAVRGNEWRVAMDLALTSGDERVIYALAEEGGRDPVRAGALAAQCRLARRDDVAGAVLEETAPAEAARCWYERGDYARAARSWDRAGAHFDAARAFEQQLAQTPSDAESARRLGELRALSGDDAGAVRALQAAVSAGGGRAVIERLVAALMRLGYERGARWWIRRLRDEDRSAPADPSAYADALPKSQGSEQRYAGRYRVIREVGSGATGRVLEAVDELTGETVALKVLTVSDDRSAAFARFMREAELARQLDDPTLVRMRALDPEGPTIVYDWMPGGTLAERVGRQSFKEVRTVVLRLLQALEVLHRNGVIHRDLKPTNVLFDPAGQARLGDLGAAHLGDLGATVTGGLVGSLPFMAPEQITGGALSAATDLYALGCVFFQMVTGALPFAGPDFVSQHLADAPPRASRMRRGVPEAFDAVIDALLAKNPESRPQDAPSARALFLALPWDEPFDLAPATAARVPSLPAESLAEGATLTPSLLSEGAWTDQRIGREVLRLRVESGARDLVLRWCQSELTALQPVYDVIEDDGALELRVMPLGPLGPAGAAAVEALRAVGVTVSTPCAWDGPDAIAPVAESLVAMGFSVERL